MPDQNQKRAFLIGLPLLAMAAALISNIVFRDTYTAYAKLLVPFGREYIYRPIVGDGSNLAPWRPEVAISAELEILNADGLKIGVIQDIGAGRIMGEAEGADTESGISAFKERIKSLLRTVGLRGPKVSIEERALIKYKTALDVTGVKDSNVIHLRFTHNDRDTAIVALKTHLDSYLDQRRVLFGPPAGDALEKALVERQNEVAEAQNALTEYKKRNKITLIDVELRNAFDQELQIRQQMLQTQIALTQAQGKEQSTDPLSELTSDARSELLATISGLKQAKEELDRKLAEIGIAIRDLEGHKAELERLDTELQTSRRQLQILRDKVEEVRLERSLSDARWSNVRVIEPPHALEAPAGLAPLARILLAGVLGLILAAALNLGLTILEARTAFKPQPAAE